MRQILAGIGALILIVGTCFSVYFYFETKYAHASDLKKAMEVMQKIETRLDSKIIEDRLTNVRKDIYEIEDRYCPDKSKPCTEKDMPELVRKRYRELKIEKDKLEKEVKDKEKK